MKQQRPLTIVGGRLVLLGEVRAGAVRCVDGRIAAMGAIAPEPDDEVVEAGGRLIAPGLVDFGVFAVDKPAFHFGGITRAALMPDQAPPLDHPARVRFLAHSGKPDLWVHPVAAATKGLAGKELAEIGLLKQAQPSREAVLNEQMKIAALNYARAERVRLSNDLLGSDPAPDAPIDEAAVVRQLLADAWDEPATDDALYEEIERGAPEPQPRVARVGDGRSAAGLRRTAITCAGRASRCRGTARWWQRRALHSALRAAYPRPTAGHPSRIPPWRPCEWSPARP